MTNTRAATRRAARDAARPARPAPYRQSGWSMPILRTGRLATRRRLQRQMVAVLIGRARTR